LNYKRGGTIRCGVCLRNEAEGEEAESCRKYSRFEISEVQDESRAG